MFYEAPPVFHLGTFWRSGGKCRMCTRPSARAMAFLYCATLIRIDLCARHADVVTDAIRDPQALRKAARRIGKWQIEGEVIEPFNAPLGNTHRLEDYLRSCQDGISHSLENQIK